jgi:hypothetical protein
MTRVDLNSIGVYTTQGREPNLDVLNKFEINENSIREKWALCIDL